LEEFEMEKRFDLFRVEETGGPIWVETVIGLEHARQRLDILSSFKPATYLIYDYEDAKFIEPFSKPAP
jgi:hypothetical protein